MDVNSKHIEFREINERDIIYLQARIPSIEGKNWYERLMLKLFYGWHCYYVQIANPIDFSHNEQLAYRLAKCGHYGIPKLQWLRNNIKTYKEFDDLLHEITLKNLEIYEKGNIYE